MGRESVVAHIAREVSVLVNRLERLNGAPNAELMHWAMQAAKLRALQLEDPVASYDAAHAVMNMMFAEIDPDRQFWATETGYACARAIGYYRVRCPFHQAAWILNLSRQRVYQLCDMGRLARMDDGNGVASTSVREEIWRYGRRPGRR